MRLHRIMLVKIIEIFVMKAVPIKHYSTMKLNKWNRKVHLVRASSLNWSQKVPHSTRKPSILNKNISIRKRKSTIVIPHSSLLFSLKIHSNLSCMETKYSSSLSSIHTWSAENHVDMIEVNSSKSSRSVLQAFETRYIGNASIIIQCQSSIECCDCWIMPRIDPSIGYSTLC